MDLLWAMVPLSFLLLSIAIGVFFWAVRHGQFDDMDSPAHRILFDDDEMPAKTDSSPADKHEQNSRHD